jgi:hypothetical protein
MSFFHAVVLKNFYTCEVRGILGFGLQLVL